MNWRGISRTKVMTAFVFGIVLSGAIAGLSGGALSAGATGPVLIVDTQSPTAIWNAVVIDGDRRFLSGPRWAGNRVPLVTISRNGSPIAFPDERWNSWRPGSDPAYSFVNINALHRDANGGLWVVDTGAAAFGGTPLPDGAKLVRIDLSTNKVDRVVRFERSVVREGSYVDDIRFNGAHAYLTDAGAPGLIVVDLTTGVARRVLDNDPSTRATPGRTVRVGGAVVHAPDGKPLAVNADPLEVSPDGAWLYYGSLEGPWFRVATRLLDDPKIAPAALTAAVKPWTDLPPVGGTAMNAAGELFFSDLAANALRKRRSDGAIVTVLADDRLHWIDAPYLGGDGTVWLPAAQLDRVPLFNAGRDKTRRPMTLYRLGGL